MKLALLSALSALPVLTFAHDGVHHEESLMLGLTSHELQMGVMGLGLLAAGAVVFIKRR